MLRQAAEAGDAESMWELGRLVEHRRGLPEAEPWFRMAADHGHAVAKRLFRPGGAPAPGRRGAYGVGITGWRGTRYGAGVRSRPRQEGEAGRSPRLRRFSVTAQCCEFRLA